MKEHEVRLTATAIIWTAFTIVMIAALIFSDRLTSGMILALAFMFTLAAVGATQMIWKHPTELHSESAEKSKRRTRVDAMLERMDDAELDELRMRLLSDSDGEAVGLTELLAERERQRR